MEQHSVWYPIHAQQIQFYTLRFPSLLPNDREALPTAYSKLEDGNRVSADILRLRMNP